MPEIAQVIGGRERGLDPEDEVRKEDLSSDRSYIVGFSIVTGVIKSLLESFFFLA